MVACVPCTAEICSTPTCAIVSVCHGWGLMAWEHMMLISESHHAAPTTRLAAAGVCVASGLPASLHLSPQAWPVPVELSLLHRSRGTSFGLRLASTQALFAARGIVATPCAPDCIIHQPYIFQVYVCAPLDRCLLPWRRCDRIL